MSETKPTREEQDWLGARAVPADALWGIHTLRACEHFTLCGRPVHPALVHAYGQVKRACLLVNRELGVFDGDPEKAEALDQACREMAEGLLDRHVLVDRLQGGAGTSTNMNVNEVLANRALQLLGCAPGDTRRVSPLDDVNRHQSTNDTFPTALRLAAIVLLRALEAEVLRLQEAFQEKERQFARVVKVGRTELQDAALVTLGREMGAYAEALGRDRWRIYKCEERLRAVNLGGTAVGTGVGAPRQYIFRVVEKLKELTGIGFARAENLIEATQNADVFVEVSGMLKALAVTLLKVSGDLRLLSSGPDAGIGEIRLPPRQAGSSLMPGKINPVIPEAVSQVALLAMGHDAVLAQAAAMGCLELNPFLPLIASCLLDNLEMLANAAHALCEFCVRDMVADEERCARHVQNSTAVATALVGVLGYERASQVAKRARDERRSVREIVLAEGLLAAEEFDARISPEAVLRLGSD